MGLDMYALTCKPDAIAGDINFEIPEGATELYYWRKNPDLHGWFERLYIERGGKVNQFGDFNYGDTLRITLDDLDRLERDWREGKLPHTEGFFFGETTPEKLETIPQFIERGRVALLEGMALFYNSSW